MLDIPKAAESPNVQALAMMRRERFTGFTGTTITLDNIPRQTVNGEGLELVLKYDDSSSAWMFLDPESTVDGYSISGATITLDTAAESGDVFLVFYPYRES